ncbi:DNA methylase N-4/N-6 domain protein [Desulfofundulus kuznetsovii DSM 6115]|uniref:site-specific DNA-methyltransferase (cytosine-N(4)-specific) n=1 Tax=Desulfofundulus kuznetsovii (strain DSM 6115 / VKM B-1805 / 17) TaxID=760568 RepID=A0AAU8PD99_DESK7|nr:DNA methylase N-4/N-6 domain protein [Desulfofundulus kuznetsovii DSM 6115]
MKSEEPVVVYRPDLGSAATPQLLRQRPVHRWFWFPHSYSPELVEAILDSWNLPPGSVLLDPFVGAGTTLLVAKERGYPALGADLSPLAVLVSNVKVQPYQREKLEAALNCLQHRWEERKCRCLEYQFYATSSFWENSERLKKAFTPSEMAVLVALREEIFRLGGILKDFFMVALLGIIPDFSRAMADGGWFRWVERPEEADQIAPRLWAHATSMMGDLHFAPLGHEQDFRDWEVYLLDARKLSELKPRIFDGLITSPPYPNRHDYSRVFQIELLLLGQSEDNITRLRYNSVRSHVEAKPPEPESQAALAGYRIPSLLAQCLDQLPAKSDRRVRRMLKGYFEDMFLVLRSAHEVLRPGAKVALVVGNVRHYGVLCPVDEILVDIGRQAGFRHLASWVIRLRGNSAQQMGRYGRIPSRETVVILQAE